MENVQFDREGSNHSLALAAIVLIFSEDIGGEKLKYLQNLKEVMADVFPKGSKKQSLNVHFEDGNQTAKPIFAGWLLESPNEDAEDLIDWQLEVEGNRIIVRCFNYPGWSVFFEKAVEWLNRVCEAAHCTETPVEEIGTQFVDRFYWNLTRESYSIGKFFNTESGYFSSKQLEHETPLWHLFQGWKESVEGKSYIENINISTNHGKDSPHITEIAHIVRNVDLAESGSPTFSSELVRQAAERGHSQNKDLLNDLLSTQTIEFIELNKL